MGTESPVLFEFAGILVCLVLSAFFSGSETALTSISTTRAKLLINESPGKWGSLEIWLNSKKRILADLLIGNNLVNILCSILTYRVTFALVPDWAEAISVFGLTLVVLVFAEITPKSFAIHYSEKLVLPIVRIVWLLDKLLFPFSWSLSKLPLLISPKTVDDHEDPTPTEAEIKYHIKRGLDEAVFDDSNQGELLLNTMKFNLTMVKEVMIPRTEMVSLDIGSTIESALETASSSGHSRLPVYNGTPDRIVGILYAKDLLLQFKSEHFKKDKSVKSLIRKEIFFAPETQKISILLSDMKRRSSHMAIVVDEFGGTAGIITLEDIIEELVGEIQDEHDLEENEIREVESNRWQVNAHMPIQDFEDQTGLKVPDSGDYESIGGLVVAAVGRIPKKGKTTRIGTMQVTVVDSNERHIKQLEIRTDP